jgi:hypothetical protein
MNSDAMIDAKIPDKDSLISTEFLKVRANLIIGGSGPEGLEILKLKNQKYEFFTISYLTP